MARPTRDPQREHLAAEAVLTRWLQRIRKRGSDLLHVPVSIRARDELRTRLPVSVQTVDELDELGAATPPSTSG